CRHRNQPGRLGAEISNHRIQLCDFVLINLLQSRNLAGVNVVQPGDFRVELRYLSPKVMSKSRNLLRALMTEVGDLGGVKAGQPRIFVFQLLMLAVKRFIAEEDRMARRSGRLLAAARQRGEISPGLR